MKERLQQVACVMASLLFCVITPIRAYDFLIDGIYYNVLSAGDKTLEVTHKGGSLYATQNSYSGDVEIPDYVQWNDIQYEVVAIGKRAFYFCTELSTVRIGDNVSSIGDDAFDGCSALHTIYVGKRVKHIGNGAFAGCNDIKRVDISDLAAWCCIDVGIYGSPLYPSIYSVVEPFERLFLNGEEIGGDIIIPEEVTSISHYAFYDCLGITSVQLPLSLTNIGRYAFSGCRNIKHINLPSGITRLEYSSLERCSSLTKLVLPENLTVIDNGAISRCSNLTSIVVPNKVTRIGKYSFHYGTRLKEIFLGESLAEIDDYAFQYCDSLQAIHIYATQPPICSELTPFDSKVLENATLWVPKGCALRYGEAPMWKDFHDIREMDQTNINKNQAATAQRTRYSLTGMIIDEERTYDAIYIKAGKKYVTKH